MFDFVQSADGAESMPRVFESEFSFGGARRGFGLGGLLSELDFGGSDESVGGPAKLQLSHNGEIEEINAEFGGWSFNHRARSGSQMFAGGDPILGLAGRSSGVKWDGGRFRISAFSGSVTDENLLETDPAVAENFHPARLGGARGFDASAKFGPLRFGAGYLGEDDTLLGADSGGLLDLGGGRTAYAGAELSRGAFTAKYTRAFTKTDAGAGFISDLSDLESDEYSLSADFGKWSLNVSRPLAVTKGTLEYVGADYELVPSSNGYELTASPRFERIDLAPQQRETRLSVAWRPEISKATKMAVGLALRVNPDNQPGHEEIIVLKLRHVW
jgi:hypothetical protein